MKHAKTAAILSVLSMGVGQLYNRQWAKGLLFLTFHASMLIYFITTGFGQIRGLITLGEQAQVEVQRKIRGITITDVVNKDHSIFMMIFGLIAVFILLIYLFIYVMNVRDAAKVGALRDKGKPVAGFGATLNSIRERSFPYAMLSIPAVGVLFFTVLPIVFMVLIAFTNYSQKTLPPKNLVDWVGFGTFIDLLTLKAWARTFFGVLGWTIIWAISATLTCYIGGILVALLIQQKGIRFKGLWRTIFIIPYAIPQFISLLIFRNLLNDKFGPLNQAIRNYFGFLGLDGLPWLSDPFWAKISVIGVNMWLGIPVTMVLTMGILTAIPKDLYEAADVDGATGFQKFRNITMPYVLFATAPILIMQFAGNINNFNVIFLLTNGNPQNSSYTMAGSTDLLVTWLYKLTLDNQQYAMASAVGIIIFLIVASFSIYNFKRSRSYREEDMIQ